MNTRYTHKYPYFVVAIMAVMLLSCGTKNPAVIKHERAKPFSTDRYLIGGTVPLGKPVVMLPVTVQKGEFTDERDGQVYKWVKIGKQTWMAQNLNYKTKQHSWAYNADEANSKTYGLLYSFDALLEACPKGWHVPTDTEWMLLERDLGMKFTETGLVGSRGDIAPKFMSADTIGVNILLGGHFEKDHYEDMGRAGYFWSSTGYGATPIADREFKEGKNGVYRETVARECGLSLRCVKDY